MGMYEPRLVKQSFINPYLFLLAVVLLIAVAAEGPIVASADGAEKADDGAEKVADHDVEAANVITCLHIDTPVRVGGGGEVRVRDVKVGDSVLAWDFHQEVVRESKVLALIHHQPELEVEMVQVRVADRSTPLSLTAAHLIYTCPSGSTPCTNTKFASELVEGDVLGLVSPHTGQVRGQRVDSVQMKLMRGISSPLTETGTILANDVVVSCYSTFNYPRLMHSLVIVVKVVENLFNVNIADGTGIEMLAEAIASLTFSA